MGCVVVWILDVCLITEGAPWFLVGEYVLFRVLHIRLTKSQQYNIISALPRQ